MDGCNMEPTCLLRAARKEREKKGKKERVQGSVIGARLMPTFRPDCPVVGEPTFLIGTAYMWPATDGGDPSSSLKPQRQVGLRVRY